MVTFLNPALVGGSFVIKCIEEQYPIDPLQKHIVHLEKSKADKKRAAEAAKPQSKRTHASGCIYVPRITSMPDKASTEHTLRDFLIHMTGSMSMLPIVIIRRRSRALDHDFFNLPASDHQSASRWPTLLFLECCSFCSWIIDYQCCGGSVFCDLSFKWLFPKNF
ncbi:unnamed protein product [Musa acuminata var. zebrina]